MSRGQSPNDLVGLMNDTKWEELRLAMYELGSLHPQFRVKDLVGDTPTAWDGEWFYHFRLEPYSTIEWCDIRIDSEQQQSAVLECIRKIHLPGHATAEGFRIIGWAPRGAPVMYID